MKKVISICILSIVFLTVFTCCGKDDSFPAIVEITTSTGKSFVATSVNGAGYCNPGAFRAVEFDPVKLDLEDGETASIHFFCRYCNYEFTENTTAPYAKLLSCDCPDKGTFLKRHVREYISIQIERKN